MDTSTATVAIDEELIHRLLTRTQRPARARVEEILAKAARLTGLAMEEVAALTAVSEPELLQRLFVTARQVKEEIYGPRLVLFAPLYISNRCGNDCAYCAFRASNRAVTRRTLTTAEIAAETRALIDQGHKRLLLVAGEAPAESTLDYILSAINTVYRTNTAYGEIRRLNVNIAPLTVAEFRALKQAKIGTYQLFQETYHHGTYRRVHLAGRKADYDWRITAMDRAMEAGIDDVGIGVLFGLYDWRFEVLALLQHIQHLERHFGVGPHTISVPRIEPAAGSELSRRPPHPVSDQDFRKLVAILRLAVPYTGMIMSTREAPEIRRATFALGISQISAGSRTNPGGYSPGSDAENEAADGAQFSLGDHRPLDEVILDICRLGYIPSFCTACYRLGRTGQDFMDLAKPGEIKLHCEPNALSTLQEYLLDYASPATRAAGQRAIELTLERMTQLQRQRSQLMLERVKAGKRDVFC